MTNSTYHASLRICASSQPGHENICIKQSFLVAVAVITFIFTVLKVYRMHQGWRVEKYHLLVFYLATAETLLLSIMWGVKSSVVIHFCAIYMEVNQFLLICVFYGGLAMKVVRQRKLLAYIFFPSAAFVWIYFTAVLIYAVTSIKPDASECTEPHWLLFSISMAILAQVFLIAGVILTREMNSIRTVQQEYRHWKKVTLWSLIAVFEVSAFASLWYDVALKSGSHNNGCDGMFGPANSTGFLFLEFINNVSSLLLPIWVMLYLLRPTMKPLSEIEDVNKDAGLQAAAPLPDNSSTTPALMFDDWGNYSDDDQRGTLRVPLLRNRSGSLYDELPPDSL